MNHAVTALAFTIVLAFYTALGGGMAHGREMESRNDVFWAYEPGKSSFPAGAFSNGGVEVTADAAVVMDADTGQVLFVKNAHKQRPFASTTKIMTALLAIECGNLKDMVEVSPRAAGVEGSSIYLTSGEKISLEELVYGALMNSGNDACVAIAEHIAGSEEAFVQWMNLKARQIGLRNTHFSNTNGLPHKDHLSSAYDLAVLTRHALKNTLFSRIVASKKHIISGPRGQRVLYNTNQMLWSYEGADGVKTGTTDAAGRCLVSSASRDGRRLIAVVLHSDDRYHDSIRLLDYGFVNFRNETVAKGGKVFCWVGVMDGVKPKTAVGCTKNVMVTVPVKNTGTIRKDVSVKREIAAPVRPGWVVGSLSVEVGGKKLAEANLVTLEQVNRLPLHRLMYRKIKNVIKK